MLSDQAAPARDAAPRERGEFGPSVWYQLSVGRAGRAEARWLLPKICDAGGISKDGIGAIRVQEDRTFVQIAENLAAKFGAQLELESGVVIIHLTQRLEDLWADGLLQVPARVAEMKGGSADENWRKWLGWIVDECRGAAYLHTSSASAAYRKSDTGKETNN